MSEALPELTQQYASALHAYLAEPREAGRMQAYDLGRRALSLEVGIAMLGIVHGEALAVALASAATAEERARLIQRAAEFQGEALAPFEMMLRGAQETNTLLQSLNQTLEQRVEERTRALSVSEERYRGLFDSVPIGAFVCDRDGVIQDYNRHAAELWGRKPLCGSPGEQRYCGSVRLYSPDGTPLPHAQSPIVAVLASGLPRQDVELLLERPDGSRITVMANFTPLKNELGEPIGAIASLADVTERKRLEQQLQQHARELAEASRRKDEFLAMLAHELRNPLAPLRHTLEIVRLENFNARAVEEACAMMERQVQHLVRLVDDLMDVSRITQGKIALRKERLDLVTIVQSALELSRPHIEAAGHVLTVTLPAEPIYLDADAMRLAQVVANLLNNATKYTEPGGRIWLTVTRDGDQAVCRVRDTGSGIPAEMLPRIFDMFVQVTSSLEHAQGGVGIGLTLVKGLVELHGGTVLVHSDGPGQGSEFVVRLPVAPEILKQQPHCSAGNGARATASCHRRILVVDDNVDAASSLGMLLRFLGNEVRTAHDGLEAVAEAARFLPEVVLLDIGLPKLNGYEVARRIRDARGAEVLLIAITGWGQEQDRRRSQEAGFDHHMVKPIEMDALQTILRQVGEVTAAP